MTTSFHPLTFVPEAEGVMVGRPDIESYALFPADGAALLERLSAGMEPDAAADWYAEAYGESVDLPDFYETLAELGFLRGPGEEDGDAAPIAPAPVRFQRLGAAVFSPPAWALYAGLAGYCGWLLATRPELRPVPRTMFFTDSLLLVQIGLLLGQLPFLFLHEGFHMLAGRRLGLPSRLGVGHRLYFVVFETTLNGLLSVPKRKRYLPFLAGMLCDAVVCCLLIVAAAHSGGQGTALSAAGRLAVGLAFVTAMRFVWQFYLFLQTDLYYVFATALGCVDLHQATRAVIHNTVFRLVGAKSRIIDGEAHWTDRERTVARWYAPFAAAGMVLLLLSTVWAVVPLAVRFVELVVDGLHRSGLDHRFWDTLGFLLLSVVQFGLAGVIAVRARRRERRAKNPETAPVLPL